MIPARLNVALAIAAPAAGAACLWIASHGPPPAVLAAAIAFSYANHATFALLHEAVHGVLLPDPTANRWLGRWCALWFPHSFTLQRALHRTHHRNNRGPLEQFDYLRPGDRRWLKLAQWYSILTGLYWAFVPLMLAVVAVAPGLLRTAMLRQGALADQTSASAYLEALPSTRIVRLEALAAFAFQALLFWGLGGSVLGWTACYAAFAVNWSSLQYADHAWSPLDRVDGAWDLRTIAPVRWALLNYPLHRAHHRHPEVPWIHLPEYVDPTAERPSYLGIWLAMWRGPRPLP